MIRLTPLWALAALTLAAPAIAQETSPTTPPVKVASLSKWLEAYSGRLLIDPNGTEFVYANPPGDLWQLNNTGRVARSARISASGGVLTAHWDGGEVQTHAPGEPLPVVATDHTHPLATFYVDLMAQPLTKSTGPLSIDTQFFSNGTLRLGSDDTPRGQWLALAEHIQVFGYGFKPVTLHWRDLAQAFAKPVTSIEKETLSE